MLCSSTELKVFEMFSASAILLSQAKFVRFCIFCMKFFDDSEKQRTASSMSEYHENGNKVISNHWLITLKRPNPLPYENLLKYLSSAKIKVVRPWERTSFGYCSCGHETWAAIFSLLCSIIQDVTILILGRLERKDIYIYIYIYI